VGTTALRSVTTAVRRGATIVVVTAVTSAVLRVGMTVGRLGGMIGVRRGLGIRVGRGLGLLGMAGLPGSRVASGLDREVTTAPVLCRAGTTGPDTRVRLRVETTVGRVGTTGPDLVAKSAVDGGTSVSAVAVGPGGRTRRGSVRARTTRSFRLGSPVLSSTVG
jgi:hypothetical protein